MFRNRKLFDVYIFQKNISCHWSDWKYKKISSEKTNPSNSNSMVHLSRMNTIEQKNKKLKAPNNKLTIAVKASRWKTKTKNPLKFTSLTCFGINYSEIDLLIKLNYSDWISNAFSFHHMRAVVLELGQVKRLALRLEFFCRLEKRFNSSNCQHMVNCSFTFYFGP